MCDDCLLDIDCLTPSVCGAEPEGYIITGSPIRCDLELGHYGEFHFHEETGWVYQ